MSNKTIDPRDAAAESAEFATAAVSTDEAVSKPRRDRAAATEYNSRPERVAKVIARAGLGSRRQVEAWIAEGRVTVNGKVLDGPAVIVGKKDVVLVDGEPLPERDRTRLWLFHKAKGLVTTTHDPEGRPTVFEALPDDLPRVVTVGRLDINTEGLLLLTNDGGLARILELPGTGWLRRYRVRAHGHIDQPTLDRLKDGVAIDGIIYGGVEAVLERQQGDNVWLSMGLREGKNREIKNILTYLGLEVNRLIRVSFGPFQLGDIPVGAVYEIAGKQLRDQLGPRLAQEAGADFSRPPKPLAPAEDGADNKPARSKSEKGRPEKGRPEKTRSERSEGGRFSGSDKARGERPVRAERPERGQRPERGERPPREGPRAFGKRDAVDRDDRKALSRASTPRLDPRAKVWLEGTDAPRNASDYNEEPRGKAEARPRRLDNGPRKHSWIASDVAPDHQAGRRNGQRAERRDEPAASQPRRTRKTAERWDQPGEKGRSRSHDAPWVGAKSAGKGGPRSEGPSGASGKGGRVARDRGGDNAMVVTGRSKSIAPPPHARGPKAGPQPDKKSGQKSGFRSGSSGERGPRGGSGSRTGGQGRPTAGGPKGRGGRG